MINQKYKDEWLADCPDNLVYSAFIPAWWSKKIEVEREKVIQAFEAVARDLENAQITVSDNTENKAGWNNALKQTEAKLLATIKSLRI